MKKVTYTVTFVVPEQDYDLLEELEELGTDKLSGAVQSALYDRLGHYHPRVERVGECKRNCTSANQAPTHYLDCPVWDFTSKKKS